MCAYGSCVTSAVQKFVSMHTNEQAALEREKRDTCSGELGKLLNETIDGELQLGLLHEGLHRRLTQILKNVSAIYTM